MRLPRPVGEHGLRLATAGGGARPDQIKDRPLYISIAIVLGGLGLLAVAIAVAVPTPSALIVIGVLAGLALPVWMAVTKRQGLALIIFLLYLALADGVIKLTTGSSVATLGRDVLLYAIVIGALARLLVQGKEVRLPPLSGWVFAFCAIAAIQVANPETNGFTHSVEALRQHLEFVPLFFLGYVAVQSADRLRVFLWILVAVAALNGVAGFIQVQLSPDQIASWGPGYQDLVRGTGDVSSRLAFDEAGNLFGVRPFALGSDSGFGGILSLVAIPGLLALLGTTRRPSHLLALAILSVGVVAGVATSQARVAIVGAVVAGFVYLVLVISSRRALSTLLAAGLGAVVALLVISGVGNATEGDAFKRLEGIAPDQILRTTFDYRIDTFGLLPTYAREIPLGAGLGSVGPASGGLPASTSQDLDGESQLTFLLIELGLVGLAIFIAFNLRLLGLALSRIRRLRGSALRPLLAAVAAPLFAIFITGFVGATSTAPPAAPYFWFAAGALAYWLYLDPSQRRRTAGHAATSSEGPAEDPRAAASSRGRTERLRDPSSDGIAEIVHRAVTSEGVKPAESARDTPQPIGGHDQPSKAPGPRGPQSKVVFVAPWGENHGGAEQMLSDLLAELDRERFSPHVVLLGPGPFASELAERGVGVSVIEAGRLRNVAKFGATVVRLQRLFRQQQPQTIVSWAAKPHLYVAAAAKLGGMTDRLIWWQHSVPDRNWLDRLATALPAQAIGCSSSASASAQGRLRPARPTFVVYPGIQLDRPSVDIDVRGELGIPRDRAMIGIAARLQPWKGQIPFLHALAELRRRRHDVHGLIVGGEVFGRSQGYSREIAETIERLDLGDAVTLTGQVPDARPYLAAMDVVLNLSRGEPFGIVVVEAMALRRPVVALDIAGPKEIITSGSTGILIENDEAGTVASAVEELIADPRRREEIGMRARERALDTFSAKHMARSLEDQLARLLTHALTAP